MSMLSLPAPCLGAAPVLRDRQRAAVLGVLATLLFAFDFSVALAADDMTEAYQRAKRFMPENQDNLVLNADIQHHWIGKEDRFWYLRTAADGGKEFVIVDAASATKRPAFDQHIVAAGLSKATGHAISGSVLPFGEFEFASDGRAIKFMVDDQSWICELSAADCSAVPKISPAEVISPDGNWVALRRDNNLWVRSVLGGEDRALTTDGVEHYSYAGVAEDSGSVTRLRNNVPTPTRVIWSPDSTKLLTQRIDERKVKVQYLLEAGPWNGDGRPKVYPFREAFVDDKETPTASFMVLDVTTGTRTDLATPLLNPSYQDPIELAHVWWSQDGKTVYCLDHDRYYKTYRLFSANSSTGQAHEVLRESSETKYNINWQYFAPMVYTLANAEIIWFSERSGWGHLYYYRADGKLRNAITSGSWLVRAIVYVDEAAHKVYFVGSGREPGRQPYDRYLYSVNFDGTGLKLLTPEYADHLQVSGKGIIVRPAGRTFISPSGRYFIDNYSRPELESRLVLRTSDGKSAKVIETADITRLKASGYVPPEPFAVTAADGETKIYGTLFKPTKFDPKKHYPVIDLDYPGPQIVINSRKFVDLFGDEYARQALAELGFIVVTIDGRGGPYRSKAFWNQSYGKMGTAGMLDDHIAGLRELALSRSYMDLDRVGITGASGGGYASIHAILSYPDFYKVAVSFSGNENYRNYLSLWADMYNGPNLSGLDTTHSANLASQLKGKLFIIHGEMDDNVPTAQAMALVDELMRKNKDFDVLIVPGGDHGLRVPGKGPKRLVLSRYVVRRQWDYFVRNLMGAEPPKEFSLYPNN
jgi:dipeptidyl-peptidase 4